MCRGYHHTLVQSLRLTIHAGDAELHLLDMIRRRRNANDYAGRPIEEALAAECLLKGRELLERVRRGLAATHPELRRR